MAGIGLFIMIWICLSLGLLEYIVPIFIIGLIVILLLALL